MAYDEDTTGCHQTKRPMCNDCCRHAHLSLGRYTALREVEWAKAASVQRPELRYLYLGFWLAANKKMAYKVCCSLGLGPDQYPLMNAHLIAILSRSLDVVAYLLTSLRQLNGLFGRSSGVAVVGLHTCVVRNGFDSDPSVSLIACAKDCHYLQADYQPSDLLCPETRCWVPLERVRAAIPPHSYRSLAVLPGALYGLGARHNVLPDGRPDPALTQVPHRRPIS